MIELIDFFGRIADARIIEARRKREAERQADKPDSRDEGGRVPLSASWMDGSA